MGALFLRAFAGLGHRFEGAYAWKEPISAPAALPFRAIPKAYGLEDATLESVAVPPQFHRALFRGHRARKSVKTRPGCGILGGRL